MPKATSGYTFLLRRSLSDPGWVIVSLRKQWWTVEKGSRSRLVAETWFLPGEVSESQMLEDALREMLRTLADRQG